MAKLDKSIVREHIKSLKLEEIETLIIDIIFELNSRAGVFTETVAYLNLAQYSLGKAK